MVDAPHRQATPSYLDPPLSLDPSQTSAKTANIASQTLSEAKIKKRRSTNFSTANTMIFLKKDPLFVAEESREYRTCSFCYVGDTRKWYKNPKENSLYICEPCYNRTRSEAIKECSSCDRVQSARWYRNPDNKFLHICHICYSAAHHAKNKTVPLLKPLENPASACKIPDLMQSVFSDFQTVGSTESSLFSMRKLQEDALPALSQKQQKGGIENKQMPS